MMQLEPISMVFYNFEHLLTSVTGLVLFLYHINLKSPWMLCPRGMTIYEENMFCGILKEALWF